MPIQKVRETVACVGSVEAVGTDRLGRSKEAEGGRHPVKAELQLVLTTHPAQRLRDFINIVDFLKASVPVSERGHSGDAYGGHARTAEIGVLNAELVGDVSKFGVLNKNIFDQTRVARAKLIVF